MLFLFLMTGAIVSMSIPLPARFYHLSNNDQRQSMVQQESPTPPVLKAKAPEKPQVSVADLQTGLGNQAEDLHSYTVRSGTIQNSLFLSAQQQGIPYSIVIQFVHALSSQVNFRKAIWPGDRFWVIYHNPTKKDPDVSHLIAAKFCHRNICHAAYWYAVGKAVKGYFSAQGRSLKRSFLLAPLAYSRISSPFAKLRFDPFLKKWLPHQGVDFAAPAGTPIHATANGFVKFIGWLRGYGKVIILQNGRIYSTLYAHMSRFAHLHVGSRVNQGKVIGYVGMSGWATGPHLHYELRVNNVPRNPLTTKLPASVVLRGKNKLRFSELRHTLSASM